MSLDVREVEPVRGEWLKYRSLNRHQWYDARALQRAYAGAGFRDAQVFGYGQTYDIAGKAGLIDELRPVMGRLAEAEAQLILKHRAGSGPWLFLQART